MQDARGSTRKKARKQTQELEHQLRFWRSLWEHTSEVVVFTDMDGNIKFLNPAAVNFLPDAEIGKDIFDFVNAKKEEVLERLRQDDPLSSVLSSFKSRQNPETPVLLTVDMVQNGAGPGILWIIRDISEIAKLQRQLQEANAKLREEAQKDYLTGVFNRRQFDISLGTEIERAKRSGNSFALLFIDLDDFKCGINDKYGHHIGDIVLIKTAQKLAVRIRTIDVVARWGGEEFVIICPETDEDGATRFAEILREEIEKTKITISKDLAVSVTVSIGVANFILNGTKEGLIRKTNLAMHYAKESGRNKVWHASWPIERAA